MDLASEDGRRRFAAHRSLRSATRGRGLLGLRGLRELAPGPRWMLLGSRIGFALGVGVGAWWMHRHLAMRPSLGGAFEALTRTALALVAGGAAAASSVLVVLGGALLFAGALGLLAFGSNSLAAALRVGLYTDGQAPRPRERLAARLERFEARLLRWMVATLEGFFLGKLALAEGSAPSGEPVSGVLRFEGEVPVWLDTIAARELRDAGPLRGTLTLEDGSELRVCVEEGWLELAEDALTAPPLGPTREQPALAAVLTTDGAEARRAVRSGAWRAQLVGGVESEAVDASAPSAGYRTAPVVKTRAGAAGRPLGVKLLGPAR